MANILLAYLLGELCNLEDTSRLEVYVQLGNETGYVELLSCLSPLLEVFGDASWN